jgi:hypothetical protein
VLLQAAAAAGGEEIVRHPPARAGQDLDEIVARLRARIVAPDALRRRDGEIDLN